MIDFHTHILPAVDDGSASVEESLAMLRMLGEQGVEEVFATPHFDPMTVSLRGFLKKRKAAYDSLLGRVEEGLPRIRLGAEVTYYPGMGRMRGLSDLCLEGTKLLLLELPETRLGASEMRELCGIASSGEVMLIIAHIERYLEYLGGIPRELIGSGALMQANASFFINKKTRANALKLLSLGDIHILGSDSHGVRYRPPALGEAYAIIAKELGEDKVSELISFGESIVNEPILDK